MRSPGKSFGVIVMFFLCLAGMQAQTVQDSVVRTSAAPVVFLGDTLFEVLAPFGPFSTEDRAKAIGERIEKLHQNVYSLNDTLKIREGVLTTDLVFGEFVVLSITDEDARLAGMSKRSLAEKYLEAIKRSIDQQIKGRSFKNILINLGLLIIAIIGLVALFSLARRGFNWLEKKITYLTRNFVFKDNIFTRFFRLIIPKREHELVLIASKVIRATAYVAILLLYLPLVFNFLPWTRPYVRRVFSYILHPIKVVWEAFLDFIPNVFFIAVIVIITHYLVRFLHYLAQEVEEERVRLHGFYKDWAQPTFKLVRVAVYAFSLVVIFPYLPGSDSPAFQGVSIFLGVLFSLGSTSAIANIVAGIVITYMRPFQLGDRVRIGESVGDVVERTLLVTRVRTIKNEDITIPNSQILGGHMKNYSLYAKEHGLILNTTVTIGYDVPWPAVHKLLIGAALEVAEIEKTPPPFVLQTSLDDFYVSYQLNAYTKGANRMAVIYSDIHRNILDNFNKANIEILSPHYGAFRDGNQLTIPSEDIPQGYEAPGFRIQHIEKDKNE